MEAAGGGSQPSSIFSLLLALQLSLKELGVWVVFVFCFFLKKKKVCMKKIRVIQKQYKQESL